MIALLVLLLFEFQVRAGEWLNSPLTVSDLSEIGRIERTGFAFTDLIGGAVAQKEVLAQLAKDSPFLPDGGLSWPISFGLRAVVFRPDRFYVQPGTCGELRFIYLAKPDAEAKGCSVPFAIAANWVYAVPFSAANGCAEFVKAWNSGRRIQILAGFLSEPERFRALEFNLRLKEEGNGPGFNLMKVFARKGGRLVPEVLENQPNVQAIATQPRLRRRFEEWLKEPGTVKKIDQGAFILPRELSAEFALEWEHGREGSGLDLLYGQLASSLDSLPKKRTAQIRGPDQLRRRLNKLACSGCHQTYMATGFNFLGSVSSCEKSQLGLSLMGSPLFRAQLKMSEDTMAAFRTGRSPEPNRLFKKIGSRYRLYLEDLAKSPR